MAGEWLLGLGLSLAIATTAWAEERGLAPRPAAHESEPSTHDEPGQPARPPDRVLPPGQEDPERFYRPPPREPRRKTRMYA